MDDLRTQICVVFWLNMKMKSGISTSKYEISIDELKNPSIGYVESPQ